MSLIERVWHSDTTSRPGVERVLPTGAMHVVVRLDAPLLLVDPASGETHTLGHAIVGGARSSFYTRVVGGHGRSVGAMLRPGAAYALFGVSASELAERHTSLDDLWGSEAELLRDQLATSSDPQSTFVTALTKRLHRAEARASLWRGGSDEPVAELVRRSGYSHRVFTTKFREEVGLAPKTFAKVQRLQRAITLLQSERDLVRVAIDAGYADQSHLCRDFSAMAGLSPAAYRRLAPTMPNHVDFVQDARR